MDASQSLGLSAVKPRFRIRPFQWTAALASGVLALMTLAAIVQWVTGAAPVPPILATGAGAVHLMLLFLALVLTPVQMLLPKGTRTHRQIGMLWAGSLVLGSIVSFFMHQINGGLSVPHYFSIATLVLVPLIVILGHTRRRRLHHILVMTFTLGVLVVAGVFAFLGDERALPQLMRPLGL